jgi:CRP/FNR family cyclic AMP-dependent transcriptional regulator
MIPTLKSLFNSPKPDISALLTAIRGNQVDDSMARFMPAAAWQVLFDYLTVEDLERGHILTAMGALDRTVYFLESGTLRIHYSKVPGEVVIATLRPGSVVGEGAFFSHLERNATVQAMTSCRVWSLTPSRFDDLRKQHAEVALSLVMALGAAVASRMLDVTKRAVVT